jgi:3-phenylpropionate/trans-cinnamate dioxygenase ferredoxin reductase subunit
MPELTPFRIINRAQITPTVITFRLQPESGQIFDYLPGQFVMVGIYDQSGQILAKKPYSLCSSPNNKGELQIAFKIQGKFTEQLAELKENDRIAIAGPFGVFTLRPPINRDTVLLAGGIGLTPLLSILRYVADQNTKHNFTLLFAVRSADEIAFQDELDNLASQHSNIKCVYFVESAPDNWTGEIGRITPELLLKYCQPMTEKNYFVCGPPIFIQIMVERLEKSSVPASQIHNEKF